MKPIIVANWKMNPETSEKAEGLFDSVKRGAKEIRNAEIIICPPVAYLSILDFKNSELKSGAQNCLYEEKGAFTGEVSAFMLKSMGCQYVILGHSERRKYFGETDEIINKKLKVALKAGLKPIFCVGESQEQKENNKTEAVLKSQIGKGLEGIEKTENLILAYEPVWAIGTGKACSIEDAKSIRLFLEGAQNLPILYGGSVNSANAKDYIFKAGMSGLLVGGASLDAEEFIKIIKEA